MPDLIDLDKARANPRLAQRDFLALVCAILERDASKRPARRRKKVKRG